MTDRPVETGLPPWLLALLVGIARTARNATNSVVQVEVLICKVDRLGDWLMATPTIERIIQEQKARGGAVVVWAATETRELRTWQAVGAPVEEIPFAMRSWSDRLAKLMRVVALLAKYRARRLIYLRHTDDVMRQMVLAHADAAEKLCLTPAELAGRSPAHWSENGVPGQVARHMILLAKAGYRVAEASSLLPRITLPESPAGPPTLVLAPFSSTSDRDWPEARWGELVEEMEVKDWRIELWSAPNQAAAAEKLAALIARGTTKPAVFCRQGTLAELARALQSATLVVAAESFPAHLATALDARAVILIGGGMYDEFGPWQQSGRQVWVSHPLPCFQCGWHCSRPAVDCMGLIAVSAVAHAVTRARLAP